MQWPEHFQLDKLCLGNTNAPAPAILFKSVILIFDPDLD